ncbi:transmembrane protein 200C-like [Gadus morhua]|uniref:transmembrane protein 200C-like n=1 Tax=Gadus morhua TaxID=8049 RepID=UPI0011B39CF3|nr:transmembrane protein 200C [Gadus morhua]
MIATGGLLRMNRRQDSLRSKNRAENKRKQKAKKRKKKNDVVVVKGKLNLCSPAGLVAAVGVMVLMVGISMAILGYWPSPNHQEYQERRRTGMHRGHRMGYSKTLPTSSEVATTTTTSTPNAAAAAAATATSPPQLYGQAVSLNQSQGNVSAPEPSHSCGFLCDFLDRYLYSDNLKVFGPLVMGIGIFLFICANAVLHENRDKKTKIINLRDIYSTVIDLHSVRSKEYSPLNGLVNYTQSRSADPGTAAGPSGLYSATGGHSRGSWPSEGPGVPSELGSDETLRRPSLAGRTRSWSRDVQTFTETVYSIYRDHSGGSGEQTAPAPPQWETASIGAASITAHTLPVIKLNNREVEGAASEAAAAGGERRSEDAVAGGGGGAGGGADTKEKDPTGTDSPALPEHGGRSPAGNADPQGTPKAAAAAEQPWTQTQLSPPSPVARATGSRLSLNSLPDQPRPVRRCSFSASACRQGDRGGRRFSCPRLESSNSKGYIKLSDLGGESFEASDTDTSLSTFDREGAAAAGTTAEDVGGTQVEEEPAEAGSSVES